MKSVQPMSQVESSCHRQFQKATKQEDEEHTEAKWPAGKNKSDLQWIQRQLVTLAWDVSERLPWMTCHCIHDYGWSELSLIKSCLLIVVFFFLSSKLFKLLRKNVKKNQFLDLNAAQWFDKSGNNKLKDDLVVILNGRNVTKHTVKPAWMCYFGLRKGFYISLA